MNEKELIARIRGFVDTTVELARDGTDRGLAAGTVAKLLIASGVALHMSELGIPATVEALRAQADKLDGKDG